jgi:IrrE N-terminal-like domain
VVAAYQGIEKIRLRTSPWAGCLFAEGDGLVIELRASDPPVRQRFSAFHEVGHTFLPGFALERKYRCSPEARSKSQEEELCDVAASELLLPRRFFHRDLIGAPFGMDTVARLAGRYAASLEASALRLIDFWPEDALVVVLQKGRKPSERGRRDVQARLRVVYAHASGDWPYVPRYKSADEGSLLEQVLLLDDVNGVSNLDGLADLSGVVELSARACPYVDEQGRRRDRVLALYRRPGRRKATMSQMRDKGD